MQAVSVGKRPEYLHVRRTKKGDTVEWNTSQGKTKGVVERKLTKPMNIKRHYVDASESDPEYLVKSDKTGANAAHKPDALKNTK